MPPPQIKQDLNRSGWEQTDFPSVCEQCLDSNPFVSMLRNDHGMECKLCSRPYTLYTWKTGRASRTKRTNICLTCARLKNCCQSCMLDLSFGLPITVRDAALKMVAPGPQSEVNKQYYAQGHERELEEGRGAIEAYEKTDEKARELLRRLANSEPYYKRQRRLEASETEDMSKLEQKQIGYGHNPGPIRASDNRRGPSKGGRPFPGTAQLPPQPQDILPPTDPNVTSLFVTGVEDDLPEHAIREFFTPFGQIRSIVCSHRSHCAFINYATREGAEAAAQHCQGKAVVKGCPLRVRWGKPKQLDNTDREQRLEWAREGRQMGSASKTQQGAQRSITAGEASSQDGQGDGQDEGTFVVAPPPGASTVQYASLTGD